MRPVVVVETLPLRQFPIETYVAAIREQLVGVVVVRSMGVVDLSVELGVRGLT
jgi:hypothetical protein